MVLGTYRNSRGLSDVSTDTVDIPIPLHTRRFNITLLNQTAGAAAIQHRVFGVIKINDGVVNVERGTASFVSQAGVPNRIDANTPTNEIQTAVSFFRWVMQTDTEPMEFSIYITFHD